MTELIKITQNEHGRPAVSGRELHELLGVETRYDIWFQRMCDYGFKEGRDYELLVDQKRSTNNPKNPWTTVTDHAISIDMAKHIAMIQRTDKGMEVREYFLECERRLFAPKSLKERMKEIMRELDERIAAQQLVLENQERIDKAKGCLLS